VFSLNLPADGGPASPGNGVHIVFEMEKHGTRMCQSALRMADLPIASIVP
jgi:hypothetical protein